ncbi:MAG: TusE/DsrC/DsvC family sulfur relay protein [bacterium]
MEYSLKVGDREIELDQHGYLTDPSDWDVEVAEALAKTAKIDEMNDDHWMVVHFIRDWYDERQAVPEARHCLKAMKEQIGKEKGTRKYLYGLFPHSYAIQACKIAGMRIPLKIMLDL